MNPYLKFGSPAFGAVAGSTLFPLMMYQTEFAETLNKLDDTFDANLFLTFFSACLAAAALFGAMASQYEKASDKLSKAVSAAQELDFEQTGTNKAGQKSEALKDAAANMLLSAHMFAVAAFPLIFAFVASLGFDMFDKEDAEGQFGNSVRSFVQSIFEGASWTTELFEAGMSLSATAWAVALVLAGLMEANEGLKKAIGT
jgi:hypothetical protein